jgi:hypothetical protein
MSELVSVSVYARSYKGQDDFEISESIRKFYRVGKEGI